MPPIVTAPAFAIRTRQKQLYELQDMVDLGILTEKDDVLNQKQHRNDFLHRAPGLSHVEVLRLATKYRRNVLLVGPTGSGKTTFANSLIDDWRKQTPGDRVVMIEDTPELQCSLPNYVQLLATRTITQADLAGGRAAIDSKAPGGGRSARAGTSKGSALRLEHRSLRWISNDSCR